MPFTGSCWPIRSKPDRVSNHRGRSLLDHEGSKKKRPCVGSLLRSAVVFLAAVHSTYAQGTDGTTYFIGQAELAGVQRFSTLRNFNTEVKCVKGGDRVWLESGREFAGRLRLLECAAPRPLVGESIQVRAVDARRPEERAAPATIKGTESAASLGLAWKEVPATRWAALGIEEGAGLKLWALGPLKNAALGIVYDGRWLPSAQWPNPDAGSGRPIMLPTTLLASRGNDCSAALCAGAKDADLSRVLSRLQAMDTRSWPTLVLRNSPWSMSRHVVREIDVAKGEIRSDNAPFGGDQPVGKLAEMGSGIVLMGSTATMDLTDEWAYDPASATVYLLRSASAAQPDAAATELMLNLDAGNDRFTFADATLAYWGRPGKERKPADLLVEGIAVAGAAGSGVRVMHAGNVKLSHLNVRRTVESGIVVHQAEGRVSVQSSSIQDVARNGLAISSAEAITLSDNRIQGAGQLRQQASLGMDFSGIRASGFRSIVVEGNSVRDTGFGGIVLSEMRPNGEPLEDLSVLIARNHISGFCQLLNDCGAIYINGQWPADKKPTAFDRRSKRVVDNRIERPGGYLAGLPMQTRAVPPGAEKNGSWRRFVAGIYLDHGASGYDLAGNDLRGTYEPYGWRVFNKGVANTCSTASMSRCSSSGYRCYNDELERCNRVEGAVR
jgi:hypothetical protein